MLCKPQQKGVKQKLKKQWKKKQWKKVAGGEAAEEGTRKGTQITHVDTLLRTPAPRIDAASKNISVLRYRNELIPSSTHSRPAAIKCQPLTLPLPLHLHLPSPSPIPFQLSIC